MTPAALEVAVVPDFCGEAPLVFEARTLLLLASWLEQYGAVEPSHRLPLHLCCIGEPPPSVRRLAALADAVVSVHDPVAGLWGGFANKLRGLESTGPGRRLLVDADVLFLGPVEGIDAIGSDFAAAVAGKPRVPQAVWESIYETLGLPLAHERVVSLRERLGIGVETAFYRYEGQQEEAGSMLPYYNSGVLLARRDGGLREQWESHLHQIVKLATKRPEMTSIHGVMFCDQAGLATALQALRGKGRTFETLPDPFHVRLAHLRAAALRWSDIRLFHAAGIMRGLTARSEAPDKLQAYAARWSEAITEGAHRNPVVASDSARPARFLAGLWEQWVRPVWDTR